jgi:hypothetical protein
MAKIKFENTYELLKYLCLKGILKGYYIAGPNDGGSGVFPKIENTEIESVIDDLFFESKQISWDNGDNYDTNDIDLKIIDGELMIVQTRSFSTSLEAWDFDLYPELNSILTELKLIEGENEEVVLECYLKDSDSFILKKFSNDEEDFIELKVNNQQKKIIRKHLKEAFINKSDVFTDHEGGVIDSFHLSINSDITSYSSNDSENIEEDEAQEFIEFMVEHGHFEDKSYEFEEDEIK